MQHAKQVEILKELIAGLDSNHTCDAGRIAVNPATAYTDAELAEREWQAFFQNHPQVIGLSGELPQPGSYLTLADFGVPILATRDQNGRFRAFVNACRHRGAQVVGEPRGTQGRFTCPFHGWTYAGDGRLMGIREAEHFGHIDKACHGLVELPSAEKHGLLIVHPQVDGVLDLDSLLGEVGEELAAWELEKCEYLGESVLDQPLNWKIANDTFGEIYHFKTLHKNTLSNLFHGDIATYKEFGRHHRICLASKYLDVLRHQPESNWCLADAGVAAYYLFPNIQVVIFNRVIAFVRIYPDRQNVGRSLSKVAHYSARHVASHVQDSAPVQELSGENLYAADTSNRVEFNLATQLELLVSTVEHEDYYMGTKTQIAANSGKVDYFLFGRNEPALHHFHNNYRAALGMPPLDAYRAAG
jgi:nitrite reductase/ring-hydroxylating ferredoxin subunit